MKKEKFYTCKRDHAFKCVFLDNPDDSLIKRLLKYIFGKEIKDIKYLRNEQSKENVKLKTSLLDSLIEIGNMRISLELNSTPKNYIYLKNTNYLLYDVIRNFKVGEYYRYNKLFIQINLTYGLGKKRELRNEYYLMDKNKHKIRKDIIIIEYNMDIVEEIWYSKDIEAIKKHIELVMINRNQKELEELYKIDRRVDKYMKKVNEVNKDPEFQSYMSAEEADKRMLQMAVMEGISKGKKKWKKEGIISKSIETAKKMLQKNFDKELISEITGLSTKEINNLKN